LKLKFQTVAEKTAKNFRGLLYFVAPGSGDAALSSLSNRPATTLDYFAVYMLLLLHDAAVVEITSSPAASAIRHCSYASVRSLS